VFLTAVLFSLTVIAQQSSTANVPRQLRFGGTIQSADGTPRTGVVGVMFSLYSEQQGGTALWTELQNAQLDANGQYTVLLGSQHAEGVPADVFTSNEARWLGIQVEAEPEQPRVLLVSVPYALKAGDAETLGGKPLSSFLLAPTASSTSDSTAGSTGLKTSTSNITTNSVDTSASGGTANYIARWIDASTLGNSSSLFDNGNVGIGTTNPAVRLEIAGVIGEALRMTGAGTNPVAFRFLNSGNSPYFGVEGSTAGGYFPGSLAYSTIIYSPSQPIQNIVGGVSKLTINSTGVGIGTTSPATNLEIAGVIGEALRMTGTGASPVAFRFLNTGSSAYFGIEGSAAGGYFPGSVPYSTVIYSPNQPIQSIIGSAARMTVSTTGVGIGTSAPTSPLTVAGTVESISGGFKFPDASVQTAAGVTGVNASAGITGSIGSGLLTLTGDTTYLQKRVAGTCATGSAMATVNADGTVTCQTVTGGGGSLSLPYANSGADNPPTTQGVFKITDTTNGPPTTGTTPDPNTVPGAIVGVGTGTGITAGVIGKATQSGGLGVVALSTASVGMEVPVMVSWSLATSGKVTLFNGMANSPDSKGIELSFAVPTSRQIISADVGPDNASTQVFSVNGDGGINTNAGIFANGSVNVNGGISANGTIHSNTGFSGPVKTFKIDDPIAPADKWLYHTSIESPDMMNVYNGVIALDARGQAWVQLPEYFEALNKDFRYQLTAIGAPGPNLFIAKEIAGNRFRIAGGKPNAKVSWQVTGIRHDAWANAHRTPVEQEKSAEERGTYLSPELFGHPGGSVAKTDAGAKNVPASPGGDNK
jgi:hypothetical protein